jgi:hypothetical protein
MANKRQKYKVGSVLAIPLPNGQYAYAKIFKDEEFAIYNFLTFRIVTVEHVISNQIAFFMAATDTAIKSGLWPVIGEEPFPDEESAWGPPKAFGYIPEEGIGVENPKKYYKGQTIPATVEELKGLERSVFCQEPELLIEQIMSRLVEGKPSKYTVK